MRCNRLPSAHGILLPEFLPPALPGRTERVESRAPKFRRQYVGDSLFRAPWECRMRAHRLKPQQFRRCRSGFLQAVPTQRGKGGQRACTQDTEPRRTEGRGEGGEDRCGCARSRGEDGNDGSRSGSENCSEYTRSAGEVRRDCARNSHEAGFRPVRARRMAETPGAAAGAQSPASWRSAAGVHLSRSTALTISPAVCAGQARSRASASQPGAPDRPVACRHERPPWVGRSDRTDRPAPAGPPPRSHPALPA